MGERRKPQLLFVLSGILFLECALLAAVTLFLAYELFAVMPDSYASAIALTLLTAISTVWLGFIAAHTILGRPWIRGAAIVWQVLFIAIAVGSFQGFTPRPDIAWLLLLPAIAVIVLLFTKPVLAATTERERGE